MQQDRIWWEGVYCSDCFFPPAEPQNSSAQFQSSDKLHVQSTSNLESAYNKSVAFISFHYKMYVIRYASSPTNRQSKMKKKIEAICKQPFSIISNLYFQPSFEHSAFQSLIKMETKSGYSASQWKFLHNCNKFYNWIWWCPSSKVQKPTQPCDGASMAAEQLWAVFTQWNRLSARE